MVEHQSKEVIDKISEDLKIQPASAVPKNLSPHVQLTYDCNPLPQINSKRVVCSDASATVIHVSDANRRTFIVGVSLSVSKDAIATSTNSSITATHLSGKTITLCEVRYEPTTAASNLNKTIMFPYPIEVSPSTNIVVTNGAGVASIDTSGELYFYETDPQ